MNGFFIRHSSLLILSLFLGSIALTGCNPDKLSGTFYAMGGIPVNITASGLSESTLQLLLEKSQRSLEEWESELSMYRPESAVNQLRTRKTEAVGFSEKGWEAMVAARHAEQITGRAFDVTVGPIIRLWKAAEKANVLPEPEEIQKALAFTGFDHLEFNDADRTIRVVGIDDPGNSEADSSGVSVDVGGIAKGLFADWITQQILDGLSDVDKSRLKKLVVDLGGDIVVHSGSDRYPCEIGIRNPFTSDRSDLWGQIELMHGGVVTSGTYERSFEINGQRYCHIVNPQTGYPIETDLVSVTIIDPSGAMADALATAVFVLGEKKGRELIDSRPETELLLIRKDGSYYCSTGIKDKLQIFQKMPKTAQ